MVGPAPAAAAPGGGLALTGESFMAERDTDPDNSIRRPAVFRAADESESVGTRLTVRRPRDPAPAGGQLPSSTLSRRRRRNFIDRLFETTMPRTGAGESALLSRTRAEPKRPAVPARFGIDGFGRLLPAATGPALALAPSRGGWADSRFDAVGRRISTPLFIVQLFGLIVLLSLFAFGTSSVALSQLRDTIRTIALHTKPAISAAERMRTALSAMDVDAASDSLSSDAVSTGTSRDFAGDVGNEIAAMVQASGGISFGDTDAAWRIESMQYDLHLYFAALGEARDAGRSKPWLAAQRVKFASRLLRGHVMVQADALESGNWRQLEAAYAQSEEQSQRLGVSYIGIGTLLIVTLIGAQIFLQRRTRRLINVPLAVATAVLVGAVLSVGLAILQERAEMLAGKTEALDRLVTLRQAKSAAYAINADQAMWLLDQEANRIEYEQDFERRARLILDVDPTDTAGLAQLQTRLAATDPAAPPPVAAGLLGSASAGPSRVGEKPIAEAILSYLDFLMINRQLHILEEKGDHRGALELRTGNKPGQALFAFSRMDKALDAAITVADAGFEQRVTSVTATIYGLEVITVGGLGLALLLAAAGLWQRYKEYR